MALIQGVLRLRSNAESFRRDGQSWWALKEEMEENITLGLVLFFRNFLMQGGEILLDSFVLLVYLILFAECRVFVILLLLIVINAPNQFWNCVSTYHVGCYPSVFMLLIGCLNPYLMFCMHCRIWKTCVVFLVVLGLTLEPISIQ